MAPEESSLARREGEKPENGRERQTKHAPEEEETPKVGRREGTNDGGKEGEEEKVREGRPDDLANIGPNRDSAGAGRENGDEDAEVQNDFDKGSPNHSEESHLQDEDDAQDGVEETAAETGEGEPVLLVLAVEEIAHRILHETQSGGTSQDEKNPAGIGEAGTDPTLDEGGAEEHEKTAAGGCKRSAEPKAGKEIPDKSLLIASPVKLAERGEEVSSKDRVDEIGEKTEESTADGVDRNEREPGKVTHDQRIDPIPKLVAEAGEDGGSAVAKNGGKSRRPLSDEEKAALGISASRKKDEEDLVEKVGEKEGQNQAKKPVSGAQQGNDGDPLDDGFCNRGDSDPVVAQMAFEHKGVDLSPKTKARRKAKTQEDPAGFGDPLVSGENNGNQ